MLASCAFDVAATGTCCIAPLLTCSAKASPPRASATCPAAVLRATAAATRGLLRSATARLRRRYPHLLQALPAEIAPSLGLVRAPSAPRTADETELLDGFWQHVEGEAADPELCAAFARVVAEVRARDREACALAS